MNEKEYFCNWAGKNILYGENIIPHHFGNKAVEVSCNKSEACTETKCACKNGNELPNLTPIKKSKLND